jgi:NDP-sugar pyrophosphorylase family protein
VNPPGRLPPVCILAGGFGTRLGHRVDEVPKPLIEVAGQPFLLHQLRLLADHGAAEVVLCVGYLGELIQRVIGEERFGIEISYSYDEDPRLDGTLGAIRRAQSALGERFLVLYGDTYLQLDYRAVTRAWAASKLPAMMTVLQNDGRWDTSNALLEGERVTAYDKRTPVAGMRWIDYGLGGLTSSALTYVDQQERDLAALYGVLAGRRQLFGAEVSKRFYEIGSPAALIETDTFLRSLG